MIIMMQKIKVEVVSTGCRWIDIIVSVFDKPICDICTCMHANGSIDADLHVDLRVPAHALRYTCT